MRAYALLKGVAKASEWVVVAASSSKLSTASFTCAIISVVLQSTHSHYIINPHPLHPSGNPAHMIGKIVANMEHEINQVTTLLIFKTK
jgi:hypothetical protein